MFSVLQKSVKAVDLKFLEDTLDQNEDEKLRSPLNSEEVYEDKPIPNPQSPIPDSQIDFYNWDNISREAVGILIAGNSGSAKTSLATWLLGQLTQKTPAQVIALDPHANRNKLWGELGVYTISEFSLIEKQLEKLEELLDNRRKQPDNGDLIIVVADELGACIKKFADTSRVQNTLERLGSEGRKYGILLISINTSANSEDIGVSGQYKNNFIIILLRSAATSFAARSWKQIDERRKWVSNSPYPVVISGAIPHCVAMHPTHGHHEEFAIVGKEPKGILPVNQVPLTIPLARDKEQPNISSEAQKLFDWFTKKAESSDSPFGIRKIQQSRPLGKNSSHKLEILFPIIQELLEVELVDKDENENYSLAKQPVC
ncbi:MAG: ATP-binding protein [Rivularia sp. (in: cyanobacteria)]